MSDVAAAQPVWEYLELSRKTEGYLVNEMNQLGAQGWELVTVLHRRDIKVGETWLWTAFLKRPKRESPSPGPVAERAAAVRASSAATAGAPEPEVMEIFDVRDE